MGRYDKQVGEGKPQRKAWRVIVTGPRRDRQQVWIRGKNFGKTAIRPRPSPYKHNLQSRYTSFGELE